MLAKAKAKVKSDRVRFLQADINQPWIFGEGHFDLVTFSLVLEHIENLDPIFKEAAMTLKSGGHIYIGELHPFKQYTGSKARFDTALGQQVVHCFTHHLSDFTGLGQKHGLTLVAVNEYFDSDREGVPRILVVVLKKQ